MCGIAGFISRKYHKEQLLTATRSIQHRGPDGEGYFFETKINGIPLLVTGGCLS